MSLSLGMLTFDCTDAAGLARFWSGVLGRPVDPGASKDYATIGPGTSSQPTWMFVKVPGAKQARNRFHPDLTSPAWLAEADRVVALGATRLGDLEVDGVRWVALADHES
jgi:hypothetical protein